MQNLQYSVIEKFLSFFLFFRDESEMEYLKIAQDLDMYGVNYFPITVSLKLKFQFKIENTI